MKRILSLLLVLALALPALPEDPPREAVDLLLLRCWCTVRSLDYRNTRQIYKFLDRVKDVKNPPERLGKFYGPDAIVPLYLDWGDGSYAEVLEHAPAAEKAAREAGNPGRALEILLLHISAADECGRPGVARQLLPEAEKLAAAAPGARGRLSR